MYKDLIALFKKVRKSEKMTQQQVADLCKASMFTVSKMECGKGIPRIDTFCDMCNAMGYMVVICPLPDDSKQKVFVKEVVVIKEKLVDYDHFNETID